MKNIKGKTMKANRFGSDYLITFSSEDNSVSIESQCKVKRLDEALNQHFSKFFQNSKDANVKKAYSTVMEDVSDMLPRLEESKRGKDELSLRTDLYEDGTIAFYLNDAMLCKLKYSKEQVSEMIFWVRAIL